MKQVNAGTVRKNMKPSAGGGQIIMIKPSALRENRLNLSRLELNSLLMQIPYTGTFTRYV